MKPKKKCLVCRRERGHLSWKDWQTHLRVCDKKRGNAGAASILKFAVAVPQECGVPVSHPGDVAHCGSATTSSTCGNGANGGEDAVGDGTVSPVPHCDSDMTTDFDSDSDSSSLSAVADAAVHFEKDQDRDGRSVSASADVAAVDGRSDVDSSESESESAVLPLQVVLDVPPSSSDDDDGVQGDEGLVSSRSSSMVAHDVDVGVSSSENVHDEPPSSMAVCPPQPPGLHEAPSASSSPAPAPETPERDKQNLDEGTLKLTADPASFKKVQTFTPSMIDHLIALGPNQPAATDLKSGSDFPMTNGRSFRPAWYYQKLSDGRTLKREWLSYSEKDDRVYCTHCMFFGKPAQKTKHPAFTKDGFNSWYRATATFLAHETSEHHVEATLAANLRKMSLPLNAQMQQECLSKKAENREIVRELINVTLYLARHCLAFRGHAEGVNETLRGNFHDLVALLAQYSPAMAMYLDKILKTRKKTRNFFSWRRQNEYIDAIAEFIKTSVKKELEEARFFSVSLDETFDLSRKEQCSCILRYVSEATGKVVERLVALKVSSSTTGEALLQILKDIFTELGLDWKQFLVGQSYDGAANMRGAYLGLQALIRQEAECALYVWCWAHRLNLAVKDSVGSCTDAVDLFNNLKALHNLVNGSKNYVAVYEEAFKENYPGKQILRLKRVDTTRWNSHSYSLSTVMDSFKAVVDTLDFIRDEGSTGEAKAAARGLLDYFLSEKFVLVSHTLMGIFDKITPLSRSLQSVDLDLMAAVNHVNKVIADLSEMRSDEGFLNLEKKKDEFIINAKETFSPLPTPAAKRTRRVRRRDGEKADDTPICDPVQKFRVETYFGSLDSIVSLISERFNEKAQGVYKDLALLTRLRIMEVQKDSACLPKDAFNAFCKVFGKFVSADDLRREYLQFVNIYSEYEKVVHLPQELHEDAEWLDLEITETVGDSDHEDDTGAEVEVHSAFISESENDAEISHDVEVGTSATKTNGQYIGLGSMAVIFQTMHLTGLRNIFPTLYTALRIAVTLPVSSASTERSFSKLKIIKNRLRTTMGQKRLESLMIISCENDILIDVDEVLKILASNSAYLRQLLF